MRPVIRSLGLALVLAGMSAGTVAAHECVVVNRSDQGDLKAVGAVFAALENA